MAHVQVLGSLLLAEAVLLGVLGRFLPSTLEHTEVSCDVFGENSVVTGSLLDFGKLVIQLSLARCLGCWVTLLAFGLLSCSFFLELAHMGPVLGDDFGSGGSGMPVKRTRHTRNPGLFHVWM